MPIFTTPTVDEGPAGGGPLLSRYKLARGITVLKTAGVYTEHRYPVDSECRAADIAYIGGHEYEVDADEADALEAAGYFIDWSGGVYDRAAFDTARYGGYSRRFDHAFYDAGQYG